MKSRGGSRSKNRPWEWIVYTHHPAWTERDLGYTKRVIAKKIPHGKFYRDYLDTLPATVGKLVVVLAYSAESAKAAAAQRGVA